MNDDAVVCPAKFVSTPRKKKISEAIVIYFTPLILANYLVGIVHSEQRGCSTVYRIQCHLFPCPENRFYVLIVHRFIILFVNKYFNVSGWKYYASICFIYSILKEQNCKLTYQMLAMRMFFITDVVCATPSMCGECQLMQNAT